MFFMSTGKYGYIHLFETCGPIDAVFVLPFQQKHRY